MRSQILLIDNSRALLRVMKQRLQDELGAEVETVTSPEDLELALRSPGRFRLAISNLNLNGSAEGAAVEQLVAAGVPTVVFTGSLDERVRARITSLSVVDYLLKEGPEDIAQIVAVVRRLEAAASSPVLVVDDSGALRRHIGELLRRLGHPVFEASSGEEALTVLAAHPEICMMLTDFYMPGIDGGQLTREVRRRRGPAELVIIGLSAATESHLLARLLKAGADDFLAKPFEVEAFTSRVVRALQHQELLRRAEDAARLCPVTRVLNRRALTAQAEGAAGAVGWVEIASADELLERHGDDGLDAVAAAVAQRLRAHFGGATVGRLRDNAFCVVVPEAGAEELGDRLSALQRDVAALMVPFRVGALRPVVRVGVGGAPGQPLAHRLADARRVAVDGAMAAR